MNVELQKSTQTSSEERGKLMRDIHREMFLGQFTRERYEAVKHELLAPGWTVQEYIELSTGVSWRWEEEVLVLIPYFKRTSEEANEVLRGLESKLSSLSGELDSSPLHMIRFAEAKAIRHKIHLLKWLLGKEGNPEP